jgi:hypothetical protein
MAKDKSELYKIDSYWCAVMHIIDGSPLFRNNRGVWSYIDVEHERIDWEKMITQGYWSSGEGSALRIAATLFSGAEPRNRNSINLCDEISVLDETHFQLVMDAIAIKWGGRVVENDLGRQLVTLNV